MPSKIRKLFVYGTLLQGEIRGGNLGDCQLILALELPGRLYNTGRGYPAAVFDKSSKTKVHGELYALPENAENKLKELDEIEGVSSGLYVRKAIKFQGQEFYFYEAGALLQRIIKEENLIKSGSWRRYGSVALSNPIRFALNFEVEHSKRYGEFPPDNFPHFVFQRGDIPVLVTAPHATRHVRMGKPKYEEEYTGAVALLLHILTGCHALYTHYASKIDPNYYDNSPFKVGLEEVVKKFNIRFALDLHGTISRSKHDIYPGIGNEEEFLLGNGIYFKKLEGLAKSNGLNLGGKEVFSASRQNTVTKFVAKKLRTPAIQLEISGRLRKPEVDKESFMKLVEFLRLLIESVKT